jgi:hypothetical protein
MSFPQDEKELWKPQLAGRRPNQSQPKRKAMEELSTNPHSM